MPNFESVLLTCAPNSDNSASQDEDAESPPRYERPAIFVIGRIRDMTLGNSSSGNKDANSQYYW